MSLIPSDRFSPCFLSVKVWLASVIAAMATTISGSVASGYQSSDNLPANVELITEIEGISEFKLSNGVQVLLFPDNSKPQFTINVTVLVGSRHEGYGETGMAHLLEHMLFKGTSRHKDIPALLKDRGVLNLNGTTSFDRTNYYETLPASEDNLRFAIEMEADRLVNSLIRGEDLASEMTVVRSEFERGENSPQSVLFQRIMATAYEWHNYGKTTIGNRTDIMRVPVDNLREFYKKFYQPDNIMVVLAGKFDATKALELLERHFGSLEVPDRELPRTYTEEPSQDGERIVVLRRVGDTQIAGVGYHVMSAADPDYAASQVLEEILSAVPSGPLYKSLVETGIASQATSTVIAGHDPGMLLALAEVAEDGDVEKAKTVLLETIENLDAAVIDEAAVKRAVTKILKQRERQFANSESFALNLSEWRAYGDWRLYFLQRDRLEKVTAEDVLRVAKDYLVASNRTVGIFQPTEEPVRAKVPDRPNLELALANYKGRDRIAEGEAFEPEPAIIDSRTVKGKLDSGVSYALLPKKTRGEVVNLTGELNYGNLENLKGRVAATELLPSLLSRGTQQLPFQEFKDRLDELSATMNFSGTPGTLNFNVQTKRKHLAETLELLKQALRTPLLAEDQLEIVRRQQITRMESMQSDPQGLSFTEFSRRLGPYPPEDVRYSPTIAENIKRLEAVTIEDIKALHADFLTGEQAAIAIVGDFDADPVVTELTDIFADWESKMDYQRIDRSAVPGVKGERIVINTPDKQNAVYIAGTTFPMRDTDMDYEPLLVGNYILGGGPLASRLADRVRKQDGLSYAIMSQFQADDQDDRGMFLMFAISNPQNTGKVVEAIDEEISRFIESGVTGEELEKAKQSFLKNRQGRRAEDRGLAQLLLENLRNDRTMDYHQESDERIANLDKQQVDNAFKQHFKPENLVIITGGDFERLTEKAAGEAVRDNREE